MVPDTIRAWRRVMSVSMARDVLSRDGPVQRWRGTPPPDHDNVALDTMDSP
jgi:hypothetical protein